MKGVFPISLSGETLEERLKKYKAKLDAALKQLTELEQDVSLDVDTKLKKMVEILDEVQK